VKTIELTEEAYAALLEMKNQLSDITNPTMSEYMHMVKDENGIAHLNLAILFDPRKIDYEPEYNFSDFIVDLLDRVWREQATGKVILLHEEDD